jgi:hypothetical protein
VVIFGSECVSGSRWRGLGLCITWDVDGTVDCGQSQDKPEMEVKGEQLLLFQACEA